MSGRVTVTRRRMQRCPKRPSITCTISLTLKSSGTSSHSNLRRRSLYSDATPSSKWLVPSNLAKGLLQVRIVLLAIKESVSSKFRTLTILLAAQKNQNRMSRGLEHSNQRSLSNQILYNQQFKVQQRTCPYLKVNSSNCIDQFQSRRPNCQIS